MAESSSHNPSSPKITPKEEPVTLDKPKSPNPFLHADQIKFSFYEIAFTTNNEVSLLYHSNPNSEYFREVSTPTGGIRGEIGINTFRNALRTHYLPHSSMYVSPPSITIVRPWFAIIGYSGEIRVKGTLKKSCLPPRFISLLLEYMMPENEELTINPTQVFSVHNWALKPDQTKGPPFTDHIKAMSNLDVPVDPKAPKPSSQIEEVPQGKKPGAKSRLKRKQSLKHTSESKTEASKSKTGESDKETQSSSAKDKSPSHPSPPTPVVGEMHKEAQQAASGLTSFGATRYNASADSIVEADPGLSPPNDSIPSQQDQTKSARDGLKTAQTDSDESEEEEVAKDKDTHASSYDVPEDTSTPHPQSPKLAQIQDLMAQARSSYPDINQLTNLLVTSLKPKLSKFLASHNIASCLLTKLKELPSKFTELSREIKELKQYVKDMEIELPGDLKEISTKLETFTSTISSLTS
ncbi:hypothetical protein Tco_1137116 [Tanacetum coccineum]